MSLFQKINDHDVKIEEMIRGWGIVSVFLVLILTHCGSFENEKPNVIVLIADDVSWNDFGCYGNDEVKTPNIDRLSRRGLRFNNAFLTTSSCSPSRISIMTGRYPHNTGAAELHTEPGENFMTLAQALKDGGYYTGQAGKWHMGELIKAGFDTIHLGQTLNGEGGEQQWVSCLKTRDKKKPFFFWFDSYDAHRPWGENQFSGTHNPNQITPPVYHYNGIRTRQDLANYYDEIARFDFFVGQVLLELEQQGVLENTYIVIMADNGRPFPRDKTRLYESGIKTPLILAGPENKMKGGSSCSRLVSSIDLAPTILEWAGLQAPESMQGNSFNVLLKNPTHLFRKYVYAEHNWHDFEAFERMVRSEDYLYIFNARTDFPNQGPADVLHGTSFRELKQNLDSGKLSDFQKDIFLVPRSSEELFWCKGDTLQLNNLVEVLSFRESLDVLRQALQVWIRETDDNIPDTLTGDWYDRAFGDALPIQRQRGEMPGKTSGAEFNHTKPGFY